MEDIILNIKNEHISKCAELYVNVFNAEPWNDKWTLETACNRLKDIYVSPNFSGILYVIDDEVKGAIFGNCEQWFKGMHYCLKEMFVATELQGTGIGSRLLKVLEERLKAADVNTVYLFTSKGNQTSRFYLKNDFSEFDGMAMMGKDI